MAGLPRGDGGVSVRWCDLHGRASVVLERGRPHALSHRVQPPVLVSRSMHSLVSRAAVKGQAARGRLMPGAARSGVSAHDPQRLAVRRLAALRWLQVLHLPRVVRK